MNWILQEKELLFNETLEKNLLLENKFIEKIPNPCNAKNTINHL